MRNKFIRTLLVSGIATGLMACSTTAQVTPQVTPMANSTNAVVATPQPGLDLGSLIPTTTTNAIATALVSGTGEVTTRNDSQLNFLVTGTVAEVRVTEGQQVKKDDVLATLDTTLYDQQVTQAEANLASAKATLAALQSNGADAIAARAQLAQAKAALDATKPDSTSADVRAAKLNLQTAQYNLQSTKDRLSLAKTQAQIQLDLANQSLAQAQSQFDFDRYNWEWILENGTDPSMPTVRGRENKLGDQAIKRYQVAYEVSLSRRDAAKISFRNAEIGFDQAKQAETVGVAAAEFQVAQAELALERLTSPTGKDRAALEAAVAGAQASLNRIDTQRMQAQAGVAQAEAALTLAKLNRNRAEIRAPFDGVIALVDINIGDAANPAGRPIVRVVDTTNLRVEVQISDADIASITLDQRVTVSVDALAGQQFEGAVTFISPIANIIGNVRSYTIHIDLDDVTNLRAGMSARVNLLSR
ncbi:MAG: HlyD family secretion protein [Roseiflexaceae bacterium]